MNWADLVGVRVQLPPPDHEAAARTTGTPTSESARSPARKRTGAKADGTRENPLFTATTPVEVTAPSASGQSGSGDADGGAVVSGLLTIPALMNITFSTTAITLLWKLLQRWFDSAAGQWVPLVLCLLFVGISWLASYATARTSAVTKAVTALVAVMTGLVLTAAVIGIDAAILQSRP